MFFSMMKKKKYTKHRPFILKQEKEMHFLPYYSTEKRIKQRLSTLLGNYTANNTSLVDISTYGHIISFRYNVFLFRKWISWSIVHQFWFFFWLLLISYRLKFIMLDQQLVVLLVWLVEIMGFFFFLADNICFLCLKDYSYFGYNRCCGNYSFRQTIGRKTSLDSFHCFLSYYW